MNEPQNNSIQYGVVPVPFHIHNNIDAAFISPTNLSAGTGITVGNTTPITITNSGVTSLTSGTAISLSSGTGAVTINNVGVTSLTAGTNISITPSTGTGAVTVNASSSAVGFSTRFLANGVGNSFAPGAPCTFANVVIDNNSEWDSVNNRWVAKVAGTYVFSAGYNQNYINAFATVSSFRIRKNGSSLGPDPTSQVDATYQHANGSVCIIVVCAINDYLDVAANSGAGSGAYEQASCYMSVWRIA